MARIAMQNPILQCLTLNTGHLETLLDSCPLFCAGLFKFLYVFKSVLVDQAL